MHRGLFAGSDRWQRRCGVCAKSWTRPSIDRRSDESSRHRRTTRWGGQRLRNRHASAEQGIEVVNVSQLGQCWNSFITASETFDSNILLSVWASLSVSEWVGFNVPLNTYWIFSETSFPGNQLHQKQGNKTLHTPEMRKTNSKNTFPSCQNKLSLGLVCILWLWPGNVVGPIPTTR